MLFSLFCLLQSWIYFLSSELRFGYYKLSWIYFLSSELRFVYYNLAYRYTSFLTVASNLEQCIVNQTKYVI
jgi:hypothetical protein